jgi:NAD(P)H-flavin reductase
MNERIKELAEQAGVTFHHSLGATYAYGTLPDLLERFAELVRQDEREAIAQGYKDMLSALRAIVAVAKTETSFSMQTIRDCANIAIKQARGDK